MIKLMLITNDPETARFAVGCGVDRIFVDLEILGKQARQGGRDTLISRHSLDDVDTIRKAVPNTELLVRVNPLHEGTRGEVDAALERGADLLMLPMFTGSDCVAEFADIVGRRARVVPLVETPAAVESLSRTVRVPGVSEIYIGLNDLHLAMGLRFMFEPLASGLIDEMSSLIQAAGLPFGFGGVARVSEGLLPGELVLAEHVRLGSSSVILSRTFHRNSTALDQADSRREFAGEVQRLREAELALHHRSPEQVTRDREAVVEAVAAIVQRPG